MKTTAQSSADGTSDVTSAKWIKLAVIAWLPVGLAALWVVAPYLDRGPVICSFRRMFALPCPGCGMTRAVGLVLHGDASASLAYHPLAVPTLIAAFAGWAYGIGYRFKGWRLSRRAVIALIVGGSAVFLIVWAIRLWTYFVAGDAPDIFSNN